MQEHPVTGWLDRFTLVISRVSMLLVALVVGVMFFEVVARYIFDKPTLWANELSLWIAGMIYLLAGLYAMQQRSHIRIYLLYDMLPRWVQRVFDLLSTLFICLFAAAVVYGGFNEARDKLLRWETFGTAWDPPIPAVLKPLILIIVVLTALQAVSNLICDWSKDKEVHLPVDDIDDIKQTAGRIVGH